MLYLLSIFDKATSEFVPLGIYDDKALAERHIQSEPGHRWYITEFERNKFDYEAFNMYYN